MIRLRDLLERMAADQSLADSLVLKGGTALNLCFGVPPRLSVDLDFNYISAADRAVSHMTVGGTVGQPPAAIVERCRASFHGDF